MEMEIERDDDEPSICISCFTSCRKVTTFFLSHVGLISLIVGYCIIGAFTFEALERRHELEMKENMTKVREAVTNVLWTMTEETDVLRDQEWIRNATTHLLTFERNIMNAMKKGGWDGNEKNETLQWTFSGALFYSIVVITTIGYGHIAPKTEWGKVVTILYAILGIPLMLLTLSHIGDFLAKAFRFLYWRVCCYMCTRRIPPSRRQAMMRRGRSVKASAKQIQGAGRGKRLARMRSPNRFSQRSAETTIPEIRLADTSLRRAHSDEDIRMMSAETRRLPRKQNPFIRRSYMSSKDEYIGLDFDNLTPKRGGSTQLPVLCNIYAEDAILSDQETRSLSRPNRLSTRSDYFSESPSSYYSASGYLSEDDKSYYDHELEKRPVPIWLCVFLVCTYILSGAFLFAGWEGWDLLDAAYFCFITLTTIGFGDFVPAQRRNETFRADEVPEVSIALCSLYLLFGISLLAMSFNLVQEEVISNVKQIATRIGIIQEEE